MEIGRREVDETTRCFADEEVLKMRIFAAFLRSFGGGRRTFAVERAI